jgi:hypothetical protein
MEITAGTHAAAHARTRGVAAPSSLDLRGERDQNSASWNRVGRWLRQLASMREAA